MSNNCNNISLLDHFRYGGHLGFSEMAPMIYIAISISALINHINFIFILKHPKINIKKTPNMFNNNNSESIRHHFRCGGHLGFSNDLPWTRFSHFVSHQYPRDWILTVKTDDINSDIKL